MIRDMGYGAKNLMDTFSSPLFAGIYLMMAAVLFVRHMQIGVSLPLVFGDS